MTTWIQQNESNEIHTGITMITGKIKTLDKRENDKPNTFWYRGEIIGQLQTTSYEYQMWMRRKSKIIFTGVATKNLSIKDEITIIGNAKRWTSNNGYQSYSIEAIAIINSFDENTFEQILKQVNHPDTPAIIDDILKTKKEPVNLLYELLTEQLDVPVDYLYELQQLLFNDTENVLKAVIISQLQPYTGKNNNFADRIYYHYGVNALQQLKANPWEFLITIPYMTLTKCDEIATLLEIPLSDERRKKVIIRKAFNDELQNTGDTYVTYEKYSEYSDKIFTRYGPP